MSKSIKGHYVGTTTINSDKHHHIMSSILFYLPEQVTYTEQIASARGYMKLKLYVSGRQSISHTTFKAKPLENMIEHDNNDANPSSGRTTDRNAVLCHVILRITRFTLRYV
ncbi:hypothetical protein HanIR_Chr14g0693241 [Helianthus annuus]|nr:hypothetical protein HanIR_Chr14g0693241 [Helianthus annuus]